MKVWKLIGTPKEEMRNPIIIEKDAKLLKHRAKTRKRELRRKLK